MSAAASRFCAVAILIAVLLGSALATVLPVLHRHDELDRQRSALSDSLVRFRQESAKAPALRLTVERLETRRKDDPRVIRASTEASAGAALQERLKELARNAGGRLKSLQALPFKNEGRLTRVTVRAQLTTTSPALLKLLHEIEQAKPYLFVDQLDVRHERQGRNQRDGATSEIPLFVQFDISTLLHLEGGGE